MIAISQYGAPARITSIAAYSPAEAIPSQLITKPCHAVMPAFLTAMPSENETAR